MDRARRAGFTALIVVVMVAAPAGGRRRVLAGIVGWPPSTTLVISEVQTGGASASDEFVEIANQGRAGRPGRARGRLRDVVGLDRHAQGDVAGIDDARPREAGPRGAMAPGVYAAVADATYSGGFAATGGALAVRVVGGAAIDAVGWGDATNAFVEGPRRRRRRPGRASSARRAGGRQRRRTRTTTPPTGSSRRRPRRRVRARWPCRPRSRARPRAPTPTASPTPVPHRPRRPTPSHPDPTPTPTPSVTPTPTPIRRPRRPRPDAHADPDADADALPTPAPPRRPRADSPTPTPTPSRAHLARSPHGATVTPTVTIEAVLTTALGALRVGSWRLHPGRIRRDRALPRCAGRRQLAGRHRRHRPWHPASRFSQRTLRFSEGIDRTAGIAAAPLPAAVSITTGGATESVEGIRIQVTAPSLGRPGPTRGRSRDHDRRRIWPGQRSSAQTPLAGRTDRLGDGPPR